MDADPQDLDFAGLVERLVPLVAELFATLSAQNPLRMHFADIANKTLLDIVEVLRSEGMSQEALAASLGMTINGFRSKIRKLRDLYRADTSDGLAGNGGQQTLLEQVFGWIDTHDDDRYGVNYGAISDHFRGVKEDSLKGVLHFLVRSGLTSVSGRGRTKVYRVVRRPPSVGTTYHDAVVLLYRDGPMSLEDMAQRLGQPEARCRDWLAQLRDGGRLAETTDDAGGATYRATDYHIELDTVQGYEAAIWDHLASVIRAVCKKVRVGTPVATMADLSGGATFSFDLPDDDPLWEEVSTFLADNRVRLEDWLTRARALGGAQEDGRRWRKVTIYIGQSVEDVEQ